MARASRTTHTAVRKDFLKSKSVSPRTQTDYARWFARAEAFYRRKLPRDLDALDRALEPHLNEMYFDGELVHAGKQTLAAVAFHLNLSFQPKDVMVRCKRAIKGWRNVAPERSRDHCPWLALALICEHLAATGDVGLAAARAAALQMDGYFRPSEVLATKRSDVAQLNRLAPFAVTVAPSCPAAGAAAEVAPPRAKSGQYDDTVLIGDKISIDAGRPWLKSLMRALLASAAAGPSSRLFPSLTLARYEKLFQEAVTATNLTALSLTPHMLRHGGPSEDLLHQHRTLAQVQERGRWAAAASVRKYGKACRVFRQLAKIPKKQHRAARQALLSLPELLRV